MEIDMNMTLFISVTIFNGSLNTVCFDSPPKIVSDGFWVGSVSGRSPMKSFLPIFELQVLVIFVIAEVFNFILKPFGFPQFVSQMAAGIFLGALTKNKSLLDYMNVLFPYGSHDVISSISSLGYVFFIFLNGVQMDFGLVTRTGKKAWVIAVIGLFTPIITGYTLLFHDNRDQLFEGGYKDYIVAMISNSVTMFANIATLLNELQIQNSELGRLALSTALVMDILSTIVTSQIFLVITVYNYLIGFVNFASLLFMAILIPLVCRPAMFWIIKNTPEGRPVRSIYLHLVIIFAFVLGWCSVKIGQDFVLGVFIYGLSVPAGPPLGSALVKKFQFFGHWFLLPIFVTTSVMRVDLYPKLLPESLKLLIPMMSFAIVFTQLVKIVSCFILALCCNMPQKDALALSLILNCKGVVEIGFYYNLYDAEIISPGAYTLLIISVMIIASIVQLSVKFLYDPSKKYARYQTRNIMNLKPYSELKIVACIHKLHHVSPVTNILDLCCPASKNPIIVDALHLVELIGSALPIFIPHGLYRQNSTRYHRSYSDEIILAFDMYEYANMGATKIHCYTAISPPNLMYENVCHLALDKAASIIFLPFHQRWLNDGSIESDDKNMRTLNNKVLEISPCSVGILVTRAGNIQESSITRLAMIFLSGKDDREGLCLAKRASRNPSIQLVVYHLINEGKDYKQDENLYDIAVLGDIHNNMKNVICQKIILHNGPQTASFLRDILNEHDYFIVGRRHGINSPQTKGLSDWSEFPELGAIGDFLASPDFKTSASVLVLQQQASKK